MRGGASSARSPHFPLGGRCTEGPEELPCLHRRYGSCGVWGISVRHGVEGVLGDVKDIPILVLDWNGEPCCWWATSVQRRADFAGEH